MITILGVKVAYESLAFFALFLGSEYLGSSKRFKSNSVAQAVVSAANYFKLFRKEDDKIQRIKDSFK